MTELEKLNNLQPGDIVKSKLRDEICIVSEINDPCMCNGSCIEGIECTGKSAQLRVQSTGKLQPSKCLSPEYFEAVSIKRLKKPERKKSRLADLIL